MDTFTLITTFIPLPILSFSFLAFLLLPLHNSVFAPPPPLSPGPIR